VGKPKGESRGLEFLKARRPAAITHLLHFFGESGKHLDPKTRFLISVVTKVINFSPRGLEQYVKRALKEGATPDEVIDVVLLAYPCAGLTKVVDAIDVILDLGLPGFDAPGIEEGGEEPGPAAHVGEGEGAGGVREHGAAPRWVGVAGLEELPPGGALRVLAGLHDIALFNVRGDLRALDNRCPHRAGPLSKGQVIAPEEGSQGAVLRCPLHGWKFHMASGESVDHPGARVVTYPVRVSGDRIEVLLAGDAARV